MAPVQPAASVAAPGLGIRYIGEHVFGISGEVLVNNNTVSMLDFTSGSGYIVGKFAYGIDQNGSLYSSKLIGFTIKFNAIKIFQLVTQTVAVYPMMDFKDNYPLLIPPFTKVLIESETTNETNVPTYGILVGRVYGA